MNIFLDFGFSIEKNAKSIFCTERAPNQTKPSMQAKTHPTAPNFEEQKASTETKESSPCAFLLNILGGRCTPSKSPPGFFWIVLGGGCPRIFRSRISTPLRAPWVQNQITKNALKKHFQKHFVSQFHFFENDPKKVSASAAGARR